MHDQINFTLRHGGHGTAINVCRWEYRNLMVLLKERLGFDDFGECGGQGKCATCIVQLLNRSVDEKDYERNELVTLSRCLPVPVNHRLSCQLLIDDDLNGLDLLVT